MYSFIERWQMPQRFLIIAITPPEAARHPVFFSRGSVEDVNSVASSSLSNRNCIASPAFIFGGSVGAPNSSNKTSFWPNHRVMRPRNGRSKRQVDLDSISHKSGSQACIGNHRTVRPRQDL